MIPKDTWVGIVAILGLVLLIWAVLRTRRRLACWTIRRRSRRGIRAETRAATSLKKLGFELLECQPQLDGVVLVDGQPRPMVVRPDYLVARKNRVYCVEVKSGERNVDPLCRQTRRQLREYADLADVDGLLLFDARTGRLMELAFPGPVRSARRRPTARIGWLLAGGTLGWVAHAVWLTL